MPITSSEQGGGGGGGTMKWIKKGLLGSGSFGEVMLYQHSGTSQCIALKKCKVVLQNDLLRRWKDEVKFMRDLNHTNIVQGLMVPAELEAKPTELPRLAMEFCSKGDLRKKLAEPANVCGLHETEILALSKHVSSAMEYLHSHNIIHRDIKPENIMIQEFKGQNVYKLTDLGFAKDSKQQPATSFVGTKEYMAPELYSDTEYTVTVDYWSFGTVISEVITGSRPFVLSGVPVVKWHSIILEKTPKDIGFYEDATGDKSYAQHLPQPNKLSRPLRESFESWMCHMLRRDPQARGGKIKDGRRICFHWLDAILNCKIIHIRSLMDGHLNSYPTKPNDSVHDLQKTLFNETKLPSDQYILVLYNGVRLSDGNALLHDFFKDQRGDSIVYMLPRFIAPRANQFFIPPRSELVNALMDNTYRALSENGFKLMWKQSLHYCRQLMYDGKERVNGFTAILNYKLSLNTLLKDRLRELKESVKKIEARAECFLESLAIDRKQYAHQASTGVNAALYFDMMEKSEKEVRQITQEPEGEANEIDKKVLETHHQVFEMQRGAGRLKNVENLSKTNMKSDQIFRTFKEENKVKRREDIDCKPIQDQVLFAHQQYCELNKTLFTQLGDVQKLCQSIEEIFPRIQTCLDMIGRAVKRLTDLQRDRQLSNWELLNITVKKKRQSEQAVQRQISRAQSLVSPTTTPPTPLGAGGAIGGQHHPLDRRGSSPLGYTKGDPRGDGDGPLSKDSIHVLNQSLQIQSQFDMSFEHLHNGLTKNMEDLRSLNWDHLGDADT